MGWLTDLFIGSSVSKDEMNRQKQEAEKNRLKNLGLDDEEIRLVMEEEVDETSFEEESDDEYQDDDYYNEDDFYNDNDESDNEEDEDDEWV